MIHYSLSVVRDPRYVHFNSRHKTVQALRRTIAEHGLKFIDKPFHTAAVEISKNPLVSSVVVTCVQEIHIGVWRNGVRS